MTELNSDLKSNVPKRALSSRRKLYWAVAAGGALLGFVIGQIIGTGDAENRTLVNGILTAGKDIAPGRAKLAAFLWTMGMIILTAFCHRALDEQEEHAVLWASTIAWYFTLTVTPVWWILHRGNITPEVNAILIIGAAAVVQTAIWAWKKYA